MNYYKNTNQISELTDYKFKIPKYDKTTTDPTYYEPTATRIANMKKAATNSISLYDIDDPKEIKDISDLHVAPGRKLYMEREEISQQVTEIQQQLKDENAKVESEALAEKKSIDMAKKQAKAILNNDSTEQKPGNNE